MKARVGSHRLVIGEIGVNLGHKFVFKSVQIQPYIKLGVTTLTITQFNHFTNYLSGICGYTSLMVTLKLQTESLLMPMQAILRGGMLKHRARLI